MMPGQSIKVNVHTPPKAKQIKLADFKKSKSYATAKSDTFSETIYDRLDIEKTCQIKKIESQTQILKQKEQNPIEKETYEEMKNILKDPSRRAMYDLARVTAVHQTSQIPGNSHHAPGFHQTARDVLGDQNLMRMGEIWPNPNQKAKDVKHNLKCTLEEFYNGKTVKLKIARQTTCPSCHGIGFIQSALLHIPGAGGMHQNQLCPTCGGKKWTRAPNELEFKLIPGIRNGFRKRLKGQGDNPIPIMKPADIYLIVEQKPHDIYVRQGSDLYTMMTISLTEHLVGCVKHLKHLKSNPDKTSKVLKINIPPLKRKLVVVGKGMPLFDSSIAIIKPEQKFGNLIIEICVNYPENLAEEKTDKLLKYLPDAQVMEVDSQDLNITTDPVCLSKLERIGIDQVDNTRDDQDQISDGVEKCPVS